VNNGTAVPAWRWKGALLLLAVTVAGALPRALRLGATKGFAWDESYYVPAARAYLHGDYTQNFEHPPGAKWAIAAGIKLVGDDPIGWRLAAVVAGIATVPLIFLLVRRLLRSVWWATFAALLVATDGMLIAQSRTAILDSLLPPLVVGAALCVTRHLDDHERDRLSGWLIAAGALLGAATAVKWQAGSALLGVLAAFAITGRRDRKAFTSAIVAFALVPAAVYVASYTGHFINGLGPGEWLRLQRSMVDYHREFRVDHPSDSSPLTWLWLQRPVSYGSLNAPGRIATTMALGNPALWWAFCASLPVLLVAWWRTRDLTVELVLLAWASLHLIWLVILRPGFIYYLTPLVPFMAVGVTWTVRMVAQRWRWGWLAPTVVGVAALVAFVLYLPIWTYMDMSLSWFHTLMLFGGWEPK
jgi:dolichyl-phosphate-mannose--protein O-mannosyl transferase